MKTWDLFRTVKADNALGKVVSGQVLLRLLAASQANNGSAAIDVPMLGSTRMPKIIHQSWKTVDVPGVYGELQKSWHETYPDWLHVLWTDEDNDELVKTFHPEWSETYHALNAAVCRADMVRNMYMYSFGGMYVDLDFDSYRSIEPFFTNKLEGKKSAAFMGRMADPYPSNQQLVLNSLPNAWFASTPGHPFWQSVLASTKLAWDTNPLLYRGTHARDKPEYVTGPVVLYKTYHQYLSNDKKTGTAVKESDPIILLGPALLYGFPWYSTKDTTDEDRVFTLRREKSAFDLDKMRKRFNNGIAFACTYWGGSWQQNGWKPEKPVQEDVTKASSETVQKCVSECAAETGHGAVHEEVAGHTGTQEAVYEAVLKHMREHRVKYSRAYDALK